MRCNLKLLLLLADPLISHSLARLMCFIGGGMWSSAESKSVNMCEKKLIAVCGEEKYNNNATRSQMCSELNHILCRPFASSLLKRVKNDLISTRDKN